MVFPETFCAVLRVECALQQNSPGAEITQQWPGQGLSLRGLMVDTCFM